MFFPLLLSGASCHRFARQSRVETCSCPGSGLAARRKGFLRELAFFRLQQTMSTLLIVNGGVKSQPILCPGHKTTGAVRGGAGTSNDDQQANKGGLKTLLPPPWRDHRGLVDPADEGEGTLGGEAEGGWEEVAPAWENP